MGGGQYPSFCSIHGHKGAYREARGSCGFSDGVCVCYWPPGVALS